MNGIDRVIKLSFVFCFIILISILMCNKVKSLYRLGVRTTLFHSVNMGSNPIRDIYKIARIR